MAVSSILQAHHYYYVPSVEAVTAIREIEETDVTGTRLAPSVRCYTI